MQSKVIAMLVPPDSLSATMLVRRASGQFAFERIDARVAAASRMAERWSLADTQLIQDEGVFHGGFPIALKTPGFAPVARVHVDI